MSAFILTVSTALQFVAAFLALRLVTITRHRTAWLLIASAVLLMAVRRSITVYRVASGHVTLRPDLAAETVALLISVLMVAGIARIAPLFVELKQSAEQIAKSQKQLQEIMDHTPAAIYVKDATSGRFLLVNEYTSRILGRSVEEVLGKTDFDVFPREVAVETTRNDQLVLAEGGYIEVDETVPGTDGNPRHFLSVKFPLLDAEGQPYAVCGVSADITDRIRANEERRAFDSKLQHAQRLESLGVLSGGIAHDFNNLLVVILTGIDLARGHPETPAVVRQDLENALTASEAAAGLCRQLLAYSGKGQLQPTPVRLADLVREMTQLMDVSVSKKAHVLWDLPDDLPLVRADAAQLRQVVMNLVTNASDALGGEAGTVAISTRRATVGPAGVDHHPAANPVPAGEYVCLEVKDTGSGMTAETMERLFEPFYTTKFTGRGLGLAAVAGIVRSHGGGIELVSTPGGGTTFRVWLPIADGPVAATPLTTEASARSESGRILVVDDEPLVRASVRRALEQSGYEVVVAQNGREAVEVFARHRGGFDLVLMDLTMPEMDGEQAFIEIRRIVPDARVLLMSGYDRAGESRARLGDGLAGFLHKPFHAHQVVEAVRTAIA